MIKPLITNNPLVEFIGEISDREKPDFLSGAIGLLVPIDWPEPFGLVMIEAMACGTPVIAYNRGSVPEIIEDGLTGFIVEDEISAVSSVGRLVDAQPRRDPQAVRDPLHRAPDGARLSRRLSQPDGSQAALQAGGERRVAVAAADRMIRRAGQHRVAGPSGHSIVNNMDASSVGIPRSEPSGPSRAQCGLLRRTLANARCHQVLADIAFAIAGITCSYAPRLSQEQ